MSGCDRSAAYGIENYPICSNHGICIDNKCVCDRHWTGYSDLELSHGYDCDINNDIVVGWASVDLVIAVITMLVIFYYIIREQMLSREKYNKVKSLCFFSFFALNFFGTLHAIEKIVDPVHAIIGRNIRVEIWALGITSMTCYGFSAFFIIMIKFLKSYSRMLDAVTRAQIYSTMDNLVILAPIFPSIFLVIYASIMFAATALPAEYSDYFNIASCILYTISYCYYSSTVLYVLHVFLREVGKYLSDTKDKESLKSNGSRDNSLTNGQSANDDIQRIHDKIRVAYQFLVPFMIGGAPLNVIFAAWYFMRRKLVYLLLLELLMMSVLSAFLVRSLTSVRKGNKIDFTQGLPSPANIPRRYSFELILSPHIIINRISPFATPAVTPRKVHVSQVSVSASVPVSSKEQYPTAVNANVVFRNVYKEEDEV